MQTGGLWVKRSAWPLNRVKNLNPLFCQTMTGAAFAPISCHLLGTLWAKVAFGASINSRHAQAGERRHQDPQWVVFSICTKCYQSASRSQQFRAWKLFGDVMVVELWPPWLILSHKPRKWDQTFPAPNLVRGKTGHCVTTSSAG